MRPKERRDTGQTDLLRARLDAIIDMNHALVKLARTIDWSFLERQFGAVYEDKPGRPPLPTRLMAGLAILKHSYDLSDEVLCERWVENPYYRVPRSRCVSAGKTVLKMGAGLPEPACRGRLQTTPGCCV
jgi:IS5 family transposase